MIKISRKLGQYAKKALLLDVIVAAISGIITFFISKTLSKPIVWFLQIVIAISSAVIYRLHLILVARTLSSNLSKEVIPINKLEVRIPCIRKYIDGLSNITKFDEIIINKVLGEHSDLLQKKRFLLSFDGYLALLGELANKHNYLNCVNESLPVNWVAPLYGSKSCSEYEKILKLRISEGLEVKRLTLTSKERIFSQIQDNYYYLRKMEERSLISLKWFLELVQGLYDEDEHEIIEIVSGCFTDSNLMKDVLLTKSDQKRIESLLPTYEKDFETAADKIESMIIKNPHNIKIINIKILKRFVDFHMRKGSFYIAKDDFLFKAKENDIRVINYGEFGVYSINIKKPKIAIATVGSVKDYVGIEIIDCAGFIRLFNQCIEFADQNKNKSYAGNFEDLKNEYELS